MDKKKKKKYFVATLAATVAASSTGVIAPQTADAAKSFSDVKSSDYFFEAVSDLAQRGIINGFQDGKFKPHDNVTRGQAAVIIAGALGLDTKNVTNPKFKDITTNHPYYGAIAALANKGYINGFEDGTFGSNQPITRNHMAIIIAKAFNLKADSNTKTPFTDMNDAYKEYITALYQNGVTSGKTKTTFGGSSNVTRGQMAQFVVNAEKAGSTFTIESVSDATIKTSKGEFKVNASLKSIFASSNAAALKGAEVKANVKNGEVTSISSLTLNTAGSAGKPVVFDGGKSTITGNVKVNADYVALNNVTVNGNITVTNKVVNEFTGNGLVAKGELTIEEASTVATSVASLTNFVANTSKGPKIDLKGSSVNSVHAKRDNVAISSDKKLPEVKVSAKVTSIEVNADVEKVTVNVTVKLEIKGKGSIDEVAVQKALELALEVAGKVKQLVVGNKDTKVEVGASVVIDKLVIPAGSDVASIIKNYNNVKDKIKEVTDDKGSSVKPPTPPSSGGGVTKNYTLSLMHTNDTHASLDNAAKRVTAVKEVRAKKPNALLLDAGDVMSGTLYFNEFHGKADLELMNLMKYDAMTFGNHEFDLGSTDEGLQALKDFVVGANFPFVSANVDFTKDDKFTGLFSDLISSQPEKGKIYNGIIKEVNGEKVGIFGLTTAETANLSSPGAITFEDYKAEAEKAVKAFEGQGVNKIIAITHIGYDDSEAIDNDLKLAEEVEGIDVIVGGHSHTELKTPVVIDPKKTPTVIVQAGANNTHLGVLDVEFDKKGVVVKQEGQLVEISKKSDDAEALKLLAPYKEKVDAKAKEEIGVSTTVPLTNPRTGDTGNTTGESVRKNETILGNLITDGMLKKAKEETGKNVIMALQNGGGIRAAIDEGPITVGEVITVLPFGNTLATMDLTGAELKEAFETSFFKYPNENGGFLHVSGAKVEFDSSKPAGQRVVSIKYQNEEGNYVDIKDEENYTIATNAFTAKGGDGFSVFAKAYAEGRVTDLGLSDWENFKELLVSLDTIPTKIEGRIIDKATSIEEPEIVEDPGTKPAPIVTPKPPLYNSNPEKFAVSQVGRYDSGQGETGTEILAYDANLKKAFVTNGAVGGFDILSFADLKTEEYTQVDSMKRVVIEDYGIPGVKNITSIASHPTEDLIAIAAYDEKTEPGTIVFATKDGKYVKHVKVGALPDMVTFTPDGTKAIVANEGEPSKDTKIDPKGSISIIDVATLNPKTLDFTEDMLDENVRMSYQGKGKSYLEQLEPEYVTVSEDSKFAYVTLQENNAIATVDLVNNKILNVKGLGVIDHSIVGNEMDANKDDKKADIIKQPILTFHMPDAIDTFKVGGKSYIITPNEGDSRDYADDGGYTEVAELKDIQSKIKLDATKYENYTQDELDQFNLDTLKGYKVTTENGLNDAGEYEAIYGYGGRSFSIFDAETMKQVFDSGSQFEKIISELTPSYFNTNHEELKIDNRSDDKGPEPETAVIGEVDGKTYGFIALERYSGVMVYDLTNVEEPTFVTLISSRDFTQPTSGDVSPEGLQFIPASESPTGKALLAATHEISGTVAVYELGQGTSDDNFKLSVMHTNDTHASLDNVAKRVTAVKNVRAEKPNALLLDAGDVMSGTLYFNEFHGKADLEFMNLMKYDAMTFGNHEFDLGSSEEGLQALKDFVEGANFPFVSANVDFTKDEKFTGLFSDLISSEPENGKIYSGMIKEVNGEKVGIFGLTTEETANLSSPGKITFEDYKAEAEKAVKAFEGQGVDKIIAITHIGYDDNEAIDNDLKLAAEVEGIDVIVGGHSHTELKSPVVIDSEKTPTVIVQSGANNTNLGVLDVEFDENGVVVKHAGQLIKVAELVEDPEAAEKLKQYKEQVAAKGNEEIGVSTTVPLTNPRTGDAGNTTGESVRKNETILGNLITDGMLKKAKEETGKNVIMALQNGGGIRSAIDEGPITVGEVITVLPFGNTLATMDLTGAELKEAFETSFFKYPNENGGFLHVSGAKVEFDSSKPAGQRVVSIKYQNEEGTYVDIQDEENYTIATNAFTAKGGDGFTVFEKAYAEGRVTDLGLSDWENFRELLESLPAIPTKTEGRIVDVASQVQPDNSLNMAVLSDIHVFDPTLGTTGKAFDEYLANDRKLLAESKAVLESAVASLKKSDSEVVLISGDLTKDGELQSHQVVVNILKELEAAGKKVFVTHGNHDILNPNAVKFNGDTTEDVDHITAEQYQSMYADFGYSEAIAIDPNSLSYVAELDAETRLIVMDSVLYDTNIADDYPKTAGAINQERLDWILAQIEEAKTAGKQIIGMTHHGVVEHFDAQDDIFPQYVIENWENVSTTLADAGLNIVFTGHFHAQDAVSKTTTAGNTIYDIETGSLVTFPSPYRKVVIADGKMTVDTVTVDSIVYPGVENFPIYSKEFLLNGMKVLVPTELAKLMKVTLPEAQAIANQIVEPGITLGDIIANALLAHYAGDEKADAMTQAIITGMIASGNPNQMMLGGVLQSIYADTTADKKFTIDLNTLRSSAVEVDAE